MYEAIFTCTGNPVRSTGTQVLVIITKYKYDDKYSQNYGNEEIKVHVKNKCEHDSQVVEDSLTFPTSKVQYSQANIDLNDNAQSFTLMNSFWFILASLLGQGVDLLPRYIWLFVLMFLMIELMKMIWKLPLLPGPGERH